VLVAAMNPCLEGSAAIQAAHVVEAIGCRSLDRKLWTR
jgi:hypothetical protein